MKRGILMMGALLITSAHAQAELTPNRIQFAVEYQAPRAIPGCTAELRNRCFDCASEAVMTYTGTNKEGHRVYRGKTRLTDRRNAHLGAHEEMTAILVQNQKQGMEVKVYLNQNSAGDFVRGCDERFAYRDILQLPVSHLDGAQEIEGTVQNMIYEFPRGYIQESATEKLPAVGTVELIED